MIFIPNIYLLKSTLVLSDFSLSLSVCPSVHLSICPSVHQSISLSLSLSLCLCLCLCLSLSFSLSPCWPLVSRVKCHGGCVVFVSCDLLCLSFFYPFSCRFHLSSLSFCFSAHHYCLSMPPPSPFRHTQHFGLLSCRRCPTSLSSLFFFVLLLTFIWCPSQPPANRFSSLYLCLSLWKPVLACI